MAQISLLPRQLFVSRVASAPAHLFASAEVGLGVVSSLFLSSRLAYVAARFHFSRATGQVRAKFTGRQLASSGPKGVGVNLVESSTGKVCNVFVRLAEEPERATEWQRLLAGPLGLTSF